ncbi:hypothetical protein HK102_009819, partial [Quaeritorhiza haematococci]
HLHGQERHQGRSQRCGLLPPNHQDIPQKHSEKQPEKQASNHPRDPDDRTHCDQGGVSTTPTRNVIEIL